MIVASFKFWRWGFVVMWYAPIPWWKVWRGYQWGILGKRWPTLYAGALKVVTGPAWEGPPWIELGFE